jgi:formylglycine-generating enzyme required for sulfatase activity
MTFAWIPPGTFLMGSPPDEAEREDNETQHHVTLTEGFYLGIHPVTQAQWQAVMGNNPSNFQGEKLPVETVSWEDCRKFCEKLSRMDGKRYRLPTEAEWEYACRAGTATPFNFGDTIDTEQANYAGNYRFGQSKKRFDRQQTTPVGSFPPSGWGLFDMHGNVWEWCTDWFGAKYYKRSPRQNPQGPKHGDRRVLRGGSWGNHDWICRAAYRNTLPPGLRVVNIGFRVVLVVGART